MQHRYRAIFGALTVTFGLIGAATVVEADDEAPTTTTTTTIAEPPPLDVVIELEADETIEQQPSPAPVGEPAAEPPAPPATEPPPPDRAVPGDDAAVVEETTTTVQSLHSAEQETVVTGTQVAVADSGGNQTIEEGAPTSGAVAPGTEIATGDADAIGSRDENIIEQQADVVLTEQAVANIVQIALILNIGAALANSGVNDIFSTPGGSSNTGAVGTGDATAVGNDTDQYVTQAARTAATQEMDDFASQLAISLWLGLAQANSGLNAVTGTGVAGSGGTVGAGSATAIGNDSLTDIEQRAAVVGSGTSQTDITQRATVMNLGFALANSGLNSISGVAGGLLSASDADDDAIAEDLFAMLLPALLESYGYGPGSGMIGTGDATAIGNQSETYVAQIAAAASSGDGLNSIVQEVLVANMGAAGANTGGNTLGGARASLDPQTAEAVVKMAAFLASMLSIVHQATGSAALQLQNQGIEIPFGDLIFQISGALDGFDTELTTESGARARIRQISIVLSLGVARSNTGLNSAVTVQQQGEALDSTVSAERVAAVNSELAAIGAAETDAAVDAAGTVDAIETGDATAGNVDNLIIICQRINADDVACLAPPPPPVEPPSVPPTVPEVTTAATTTTVVRTATEVNDPPSTTMPALIPPVAAGNPPSGFRAPSAAPLPSTGSNVDTILWGAALLVLLGGCLVLLRRRRGPLEV